MRNITSLLPEKKGLKKPYGARQKELRQEPSYTTWKKKKKTLPIFSRPANALDQPKSRLAGNYW